jgi:hypothetical protein
MSNKLRAKTEYLNSTDLRRRGWTTTAILRFAGEPDDTCLNPYYLSGPLINRYLKKRIEQIERTNKFQDWLDKSKKRKQGASVGVETKRQKLMCYLDGVKIDVPIIDKERLIQEAVKHYNAMSFCSPGPLKIAHETDNEEFLLRIAVNYLRHELSDYEDELYEIYGKVGVREAVSKLREKVYDAIGTAYPWLDDECRRQFAKRNAAG